jgi:hypothetical protein
VSIYFDFIFEGNGERIGGCCGRKVGSGRRNWERGD